MIPYAMAMADILLPGGKKLETRILEPRADGFTFRVSGAMNAEACMRPISRIPSPSSSGRKTNPFSPNFPAL